MNRPAAFLAFALVIAGCMKPVPPVFEEAVPLPLPAGSNSLGPRITVGADQQVLLSWMERAAEGGVLRVATLGPAGWQAAGDVVTDPQMFVNWADLPGVRSWDDGHWVAHWLSRSGDAPYSYDTRFAQSRDAGVNWSAPILPHTDGTRTEHGFVSTWPHRLAGQAVTGLVWLDGRRTGGAAAGEPATGGMTLRAAFVDGAGKRSGEQEIDGLVCDCCQTDVAISSLGPVAVYRDRTRAEIRDIYLSRFEDGAWQPPERLSGDDWEIDACPVNGPAIAAEGDLVAVAWFTAARNSPIVKLRISKDGGRRFGDVVIIDTVNLLGHVDVAYIGDSSFAVSWLRDGEDVHDIRVRSVTSAGELGPPKTVGRTASSRVVPQMAAARGDLIFAWTDESIDESRVASARVEIVLAK